MDDRENSGHESGKLNGSGIKGDEGSGGALDKGTPDKIVQFPTLAERDRQRREKAAAEEQWRKNYKAREKALKKANNPPFLNVGNIPPFVKVMAPLLLGIHVAITLFLNETDIFHLYNYLGFVPQKYFSGQFGFGSLIAPLSYTFLHGGWMHMIFNLFMLVALGTFFARDFGTKITAMFYVLCGIGGALFYLMVNPFAQNPLIGASGSISGFFGVFLIMMYKRGTFSGFKITHRYGVMPIIVFWLGLMILIALAGGGHSWEAHIGGFLTGIAFLCWLLHGHLKIWRL
ncbi:MAG: rhomboid family intramembrane serine protease [Alphaproteobacteria bacterium]